MEEMEEEDQEKEEDVIREMKRRYVNPLTRRRLARLLDVAVDLGLVRIVRKGRNLLHTLNAHGHSNQNHGDDDHDHDDDDDDQPRQGGGRRRFDDRRIVVEDPDPTGECSENFGLVLDVQPRLALHVPYDLDDTWRKVCAGIQAEKSRADHRIIMQARNPHPHPHPHPNPHSHPNPHPNPNPKPHPNPHPHPHTHPNPKPNPNLNPNPSSSSSSSSRRRRRKRRRRRRRRRRRPSRWWGGSGGRISTGRLLRARYPWRPWCLICGAKGVESSGAGTGGRSSGWWSNDRR